MAVALTALSAVQVHLQVAVSSRNIGYSLDGSITQRSPP